VWSPRLRSPKKLEVEIRCRHRHLWGGELGLIAWTSWCGVGGLHDDTYLVTTRTKVRVWCCWKWSSWTWSYQIVSKVAHVFFGFFLSLLNSRNTNKHAQLKQQQKHEQARSIEVENEVMYTSKRRSFSRPTVSVFFCDCCWGIQSY